MRRSIFSSILATGMALGCGTPDTENTENYRIALVLPYSEEFASRGKEYENAITLAVEDLYAAGFTEAAGGRKFEFTLISSGGGEGDVKEALGREFESRRLPEGGTDFTAVIGSTGAAQNGATEISGINQVPHFETSTGSHHDEFVPHVHLGTEVESYLFSTRSLCLPEAIVTADFIHAKYPGQKVALFRGSLTHDIMHTNTIRDRLTELGFTGTVLISDHDAPVDPVFGENEGDYMLSYDKGTFQDEIQSVIDSEAPDVVYFHLRGDNHNLRFLQDANRANFQGDIVTCGMARGPIVIDKELNGNINEYLEDRLHFVMRAPIPSEQLKTYQSRFEERFPEFKASTFNSANYDAMMLVGLAALKAFPQKNGASIRDAIEDVSTGGTKFESHQLAEAIAAIQAGQEIDYDGPSGTLDLNENRIAPGSFFIEVVESDGAQGLKYTELTDPIGRVIRTWDEE